MPAKKITQRADSANVVRTVQDNERLFIDDFCISRYSEDGIKILYHLLKSRADLHYPTVFNTQYEPSEWSKWLSDDPGCFGKLDGIRRRLTTGFTVEIVKL